MKNELTIDLLTQKRRSLWERFHDKELDKSLVESIADEILDSEKLRSEVTKRPYLLIEATFTVVDKKKKNVPFFFNDVQKEFISILEKDGSKKPYFILKGRQQGFTTLISAIMLSYAIVQRNFAGFTLADRDDNTKAIFQDKAKFMYSFLPERLKPSEKFNSTNELYFDKLNSSFRIASATSNVGRSRTLSFVHFSEVAFFKCGLSDLQKSVLEAATEDAICIYETTANGLNEAKTLWDSGSCTNLFFEWWKTKEYVSKEYDFLKSPDTWLKSRLKMLKEIGLSKEQITWYAKKYHSYIDKSSIKQEYPCTPEEAFLTSGDCVFDKEKILNYLSQFDIKARVGYFKYKLTPKPIYSPSGELSSYKTVLEDISFVEDDSGYVSIVEEPKSRVQGTSLLLTPYVIGADTAGTGEDYFCAKVIDNVTQKCVATLHIKNIDEDLFAHQLYCLGKYYNDALIGVETNFSQHPVRVLRALDYKNLYSHKTQESESRYGFLTTSVSRPIIISNLVSVMREDIYLETDRQTLIEMSTFIKGRDMRAEGAPGTHDDLVMASAIARYVGIDYLHVPKIVDKSNDFLKSHFSPISLQEETYMEW